MCGVSVCRLSLRAIVHPALTVRRIWMLFLGTLVGFQGKGRSGGGASETRANPQRKHAIANCSQTAGPTLLPGEYRRRFGLIHCPQRFRILSDYFGACWPTFAFMTTVDWAATFSIIRAILGETFQVLWC